MTNQEKLVNFMIYKRETLPLAYWYEYFNDEDATDILKWTDEECEKIIKKINKEIEERIKFGYYMLFGNPTCPFCIIFNNNCGNCSSYSYGKRHGRCSGREENDYQMLEEIQYFGEVEKETMEEALSILKGE